MDNELLVKSIRGLCKKNEISVSQLENELNFGAGLISRWSKNSPSIDKIVSIADRFGISIDETIGRTVNLKSKTTESFIDKLYNMTTKNSITWEDETDSVLTMQEDDNCNIEDDGYEYFELYTTKYNNGVIYLYAQYDKEKGIISDIDLQLYIQPNRNAVLVLQECDETKLYDLWYYVQAKFNGELDEIKAEEFKNNFINTPENISNEKISDFLTDPSIMKLIETVDTKEFRKVQQVFEDPEFKSALQMLNNMQSHFDNKK